ncbi:SDR family oxidoreductase [Mucilaginibacter sp. RS28]|uniref:SDR family oxidoreductase n=1 Tax=Mucilaginibacter straminoryzae TaxID=2932774 RepID=A0A9X2BBY5_9SPHI|nr:SDR family oxidoreductase [Mucilaginibacter straminoryzae]MCJ8210332.1 SDR family oxidoreductase [Mucilaginibacter straminoryzae]
MENLTSKVILVTGGAQGLGKATCLALAEAGATVIVGDIQEDKARAVVDQINQNGKAVFYRLDLTDASSVEQTINTIHSEQGRIDGLVNNAGIDFTKPITELAVSEWDAAMNVNLRGPFLTSKFVLPLMAEQKGGHIINVVSTAALRAWTEASVYHATKWGLRGFTQALFTEARKVGVKVTGLIAGGMRTPFLLDRFPDIPPQNLQDPENVAEKIRYILADESQTIVPELLVLPLMETSWP